MTIEDRLKEFLENSDFHIASDVTPTTSLIRSGMLDSLALFQLYLWIEEELGEPIDITRVDVANDWDSISDVAIFIRNRTGQIGSAS